MNIIDGKSYEKAIEYINSLSQFVAGTGCERAEKLLERLGNPQDKLKVIHVAGSNGKGSVCAYLAGILQENGYKTNRTAASLFNNGTYVERSSLQPGDIICFYNGGYSYIGHVGIYIGNNQFIHASSSCSKVVIDSLSTAYYNNHYYGARRIAG